MPVVTIFRQAGCEGRHIAESVAQTLGYHLSDYLTVERILQRYGIVQFRDLYGSVPDFWDRFTRRGLERDEMNVILRSVTLAEARHGNVVMLGRGCFAPLQGMADVLNVRLKAPLSARVARIMSRLGLTMDEATTFVHEKDALVADFGRTSYGLSPDDLGLFDLVIDTAKISPEAAVRWIVESACGLQCPDRAAGTLGEDPSNAIMTKLVAEEFGCNATHS